METSVDPLKQGKMHKIPVTSNLSILTLVVFYIISIL